MPEVTPPPQPAAQPGTWTDPYGAFNWRIDIRDKTEARFCRCTGIGARVKAPAYREGGAHAITHRLVGPVEYADVTLEYGLTDSREMWNWMLASIEGRVERINVSVVMLKSDGVTEAYRWDLMNAWPAEWRLGPLDAMGHEVAIAYLTLVYESLEMR